MLLLDSHALLWLVNDAPVRPGVLDAIEDAQALRNLYVSPITAWELGTAELKRSNRPGLGMPPADWFRQALRQTGARLATITPAIAAEVASVPAIYGRADPGDCFMIATARLRRLHLVTRDAALLKLAATRPDYLQALPC